MGLRVENKLVLVLEWSSETFEGTWKIRILVSNTKVKWPGRRNGLEHTGGKDRRLDTDVKIWKKVV